MSLIANQLYKSNLVLVYDSACYENIHPITIRLHMKSPKTFLLLMSVSTLAIY